MSLMDVVFDEAMTLRMQKSDKDRLTKLALAMRVKRCQAARQALVAGIDQLERRKRA